MENTEYRLYIELDALLDTRLGTVDLIDPTMAEALVNNPLYIKRNCDDFSVFRESWDNDVYKQRYATRDVDTLKHSRLSNAIYLLQHDIDCAIKEMGKTPWIQSIAVDLNIYPYRLSDAERDAIAISMREYIGYGVSLTVINTPYREMTYEYIERTWVVLIMYNLLEWISLHSHDLDTATRAHQITLQAPLIHVDKASIPTEQYAYEEGDIKITPMEIFERFMGQFIGINLVDAESFTVVEIPSEDPTQPKT